EEIDSAGVGAGRQDVEGRGVRPSVHGGGEQPEARIATVEVAPYAADEVVRGRLHLVPGVRPGGRVEHRGALPSGERVEHAYGPAPGRPPAQLGGAEDRGAGGHVLEIPVRFSLGVAADTARVKVERRAAEIVDAASVAPEVENLGALDEERPVFLEELLEGGQVHERLVHLDLPEVGVQGGVERQARAHAVLQ